MMTQSEIVSKYGEAGESNLVTLSLPYPMRLAWDTSTYITKMRCHRLVHDAFLDTFTDLLRYYGLGGIEELKIDFYGGCYNYRNMRGGSKLSRHSWGIALDLHPEMNQLRWGKDKALFAQPDYEKMIEIFYNNGFVSYGIEKNYDWMHFEIGQ